MAVTSPDNIRTPDSGDQYALVQDLGVLAGTTQAAISKRGNLYIGTAAQRTAFVTAPNGTNWQDTDGTLARYVRVAGAWVMQGDRGYTGTAAQRTAFTTAPNGSLWSDTDGTKLVYKRDGSTWVSVGLLDSGWVNLTSSVSTAYRGIMEARKVGTTVELRMSTLEKSIPPGSPTVATLPSMWWPTSGTTLTPRGATYLDGAPSAGSSQLNLNGTLVLLNPTSTDRAYAATSLVYSAAL